MSKNGVFIAIIACVLVFSAIAYGVYINVSGRAHVMEKTRIAESVQTTVVMRRDIAPALRASVRLEPAWMADVYTTVEGKIVRLLFSDGGAVYTGDVIAEIEGWDMAAQLRQAEGNVTAAKAGYDQAVSELRRAELLSMQNAIAERTVEAARFRLEQMSGQMTTAQGALDQAKYRMDGLLIKAPRTGIIVRYFVTPGQYVHTGMPVASLMDDTALKVKVPFTGANYTDWKIGDTVEIELAEKQVRGKITRLDYNQAAGSNQLLELYIDNGQKALQAALYTDIVLRMPVIKNVLTVPDQAILIQGGKSFVYCIDKENKVNIRSVTPGYHGDGMYVIKSGLTDGEKVVVQGQSGLSEGMMLSGPKGAGQQ